jgi:hypothetical protein
MIKSIAPDLSRGLLIKSAVVKGILSMGIVNGQTFEGCLFFNIIISKGYKKLLA